MRKSKWLPSSEIFRVNITKKQIFEKENIKNRLGWMMPVWISSSFGRTEADMFGSSLECLAECLLYRLKTSGEKYHGFSADRPPQTSNSRFLGFPRKPKLHFHAAGLFLSPFIFDIKKSTSSKVTIQSTGRTGPFFWETQHFRDFSLQKQKNIFSQMVVW